MAFTHIKKVNVGPFIKARIRIRSQTSKSGSGSDQKGPDPTGSVTLLYSVCQKKSNLSKNKIAKPPLKSFTAHCSSAVQCSNRYLSVILIGMLFKVKKKL
jgi:hypothetical protein